MRGLLHELIVTISGEEIDHEINEHNAFVNVNWTLTNKKICEYETLYDILGQFPVRDLIEITINNTIDEKIVVSNKDIGGKQKEYIEYRDNIDMDDVLEIHIMIRKKIVENIMSIYNLDAFNKYLFSKNLFDTLLFFENSLKDRKSIVFELYDSNLFLGTDTILFKPVEFKQVNCSDFNRSERSGNCMKNCNVFGFDGQLPLPNDFHFIIDDETDNPYRELFHRIESLLSTIYMSDSVHMKKDKMICQVFGQRMNTYDIVYDELEYNEVLFDVYSWIYTDGNVVDKVTLARNLLSLHCKHERIDRIDSKTFMSIKANFALYQKENVNKYIELKNGMTIFLKDVLNQSRDIVMDIVGQIGKNITACLSFILTAFLSNVLSGSSTGNIFTKDITYLSYTIMVGSMLYLIITLVLSVFKSKEIRKGYNLIKSNNDFLIGTKEYEDIFRDKDIDKIVEETRIYKWCLFILWFLLILLFFIFVENTSDYGFTKIFFESAQGK